MAQPFDACEKFRVPREPLLALLASLPLWIVAGGCGSSHAQRLTQSNSTAVPFRSQQRHLPTDNSLDHTGSKGSDDYDSDDNPVRGQLGQSDGDRDERGRFVDKDGDYDSHGHGYFDPDEATVLRLGHTPDSAEQHSIASLIRSYYNAAAAADGKRVCRLVYAELTKTLPTDLSTGGTVYLRGLHGCALVETKLLSQNPVRARMYASRLRFVEARVKAGHGVALVGFRGLPSRQIELRREGARWKLDALLDNALP